MQGDYPVITLCGSTRFKAAFMEAQKRLSLEGNIVISVGLFGHAGDCEVWEGMDEGTFSKTKEMLDDMHKRKIDMADSIYVINVNGYIGESTKSEIAYAKAHGKGVRYLVEKEIEPEHYLFTIQNYLKRHHIAYNTDIIKSIRNRQNGKRFSLNEHIKAMIYALLTNQTVWNRIVPFLGDIDKVFHDYDAVFIKTHNPDDFAEKIFCLKCGNRSTRKQMSALKGNIEVFERLEQEYGAVDTFIGERSSAAVVAAFSQAGSTYKLDMMGEALVWEYLRNVGIDGVKPDTHIRRFLGSNRMGAADAGTPATVSEIYEQVDRLSEKTGLLKAEIDNLIWSFCAEGYGEVCTAKPHCDECPIKSKCRYGKLPIPTKRAEKS